MTLIRFIRGKKEAGIELMSYDVDSSSYNK